MRDFDIEGGTIDDGKLTATYAPKASFNGTVTYTSLPARPPARSRPPTARTTN